MNEIMNNPGILPKIAVAIFRFGNFSSRVKVFYPLWKLIDTLFMKMNLNTELPARLKVGKGLVMWHPYGVIINDGAELGENVTILHHVTIGNTGPGGDEKTPIIGDNVIIGSGAKIIGGIMIGSNSKIGANAVVTKSFPENSVLVGIPARDISEAKN